MEIDKDRFNFIRAEGTLYHKTLLKVHYVIQGFLENKPYTIDWDEVLRHYERKGRGDISEFACSYTFGWHAIKKILEDDVSKQAMYLEIVDGIIERYK